MKVVYDVDTQYDFMMADGALCVPEAEGIIPNLSRVMECARDNDILIVGSVDAHTKDDPEFEVFPPHCVVGTKGQKKIPETIVHNDALIYTVPNNGNGIDINVAQDCFQVYFEKQTYNIWDKALGQPDNLQTLLRAEDVIDIYVVGVASNICVLAAVEGFVERGYHVHVVSDAIKGLHVADDNNEETAMFRMRELGIKFLTTEEFVTICNEED